MRKELQKLKPKKTYIFIGKIHSVQYQRLMIQNIKVYENEKYLCIVNHELVAKKPFRGCIRGDVVKFTGKVKPYIRGDGSKDIGLVDIKFKNIL